MKVKLQILVFTFLYSIWGNAQHIGEPGMEFNILGNSWLVGAGYTKSSTQELEFNLGRTYGYSHSGVGRFYSAASYGVGYSPDFGTTNFSENFKAFFSLSYLNLGGGLKYGFTARAEYLYDINNQAHYLRPSVGLSALFVDVLYSYTIPLSGTNVYMHGITFRLNGFFLMSNWEHESSGVYPYQ